MLGVLVIMEHCVESVFPQQFCLRFLLVSFNLIFNKLCKKIKSVFFSEHNEYVSVLQWCSGNMDVD